MNRSLFVLIFVLIILLAISTGAARAAVFEVTMAGQVFHPDDLTVAVGDSVHWFNDDITQHTVTSGGVCEVTGLFDSGVLQPGEDFGFRFTEIADIPYNCQVHCPSMQGMVRVHGVSPTQDSRWGRIKSLFR
jgi:plastocyanin